MNCVYKITNKTNNKVYIGETLNKDKRWKEHIDALNSNSHHSWKLQASWNKHGSDNFVFEVIDSVKEEHKPYSQKLHLLIKEYICMKEYNSIENGYNIEETLKDILTGNKTDSHMPKSILLGMYKELCDGTYEFPNEQSLSGADRRNIIVTFDNGKVVKELKLEMARQSLKRVFKRPVSMVEIYNEVINKGGWEIDNIKIYKK